MGKRSGTDCLLYVIISSTPTLIAGLTGNTMSVNGEMIDVTTKDSKSWRELLAGVRSWSMSGDGAFDDAAAYGFNDLFDAFSLKDRLLVRFSFEESGLPYYEGYAYLASLEQTAPLEDKITFTFTLEGDGELEKP